MPPRKNKKTEQAQPSVEVPIVSVPEPVVSVPEPVPVAPVPVAPVSVAPVPVKAKKTKKQIQVVALVTPEGIEGTFQPAETRRSLIAHLHIHSNEVKFSDSVLHYDPSPPKQPEPYDGDADDLYSNYTRAAFETPEEKATTEIVEDLGKPVPIADPLGNPQSGSKAGADELDSDKPLQPFYRCNLMVKYKDASDSSKLPDSVDVACFWCTECFENQPCVIPEREEKKIYKVYGNFCSPECALSYLLSENLDSHVRWERMSLLHRLYSDLYPNRIFPAAARESLKKFGGPMSIEQYRNTMYSKQVRVDIQMPPLVSILGTMDTKPIDFYDTSTKGNTGSNMTERFSKAEEGLRLRRTKPLKDKESTLDACMKISIKPNKI
jgi:hypothetical protein